MSPFIRDNDVVTVCPRLHVSPRFGDVVAFVDPLTKRLIIHRIIGKKDNSYIIRGDNTTDYADLVTQSSIIGYVRNVVRSGKKVVVGLGPERFFVALLMRGKVFHIIRLVWRYIKHITG